MGKLVSLFKNNKFQSFLCGVLGGFIVFIVFGIDCSLSGSLAEWLSAPWDNRCCLGFIMDCF